MKNPAALIPAATHASTAARAWSGVMPFFISLSTRSSPDSMPKKIRLQPARCICSKRAWSTWVTRLKHSHVSGRPASSIAFVSSKVRL